MKNSSLLNLASSLMVFLVLIVVSYQKNQVQERLNLSLLANKLTLQQFNNVLSGRKIDYLYFERADSLMRKIKE